MKERSNRRLGFMIGGAAVLLVLMLVAPMLKPSSTPEQREQTPSIVADDAFGISGSTTLATTATTATTEADSAAFTLGGGEIFSLIWRVALVLGVLAVCIVGLRWWSKRASGPRSTTGYLRIIDTLPIQGGRSVHLVAVGERVIVVGATAQQLSYLAELKDEEATSLLTERETPEHQSVSAFAAQLFQSLRRDERTVSPPNSQIIGEYE